MEHYPDGKYVRPRINPLRMLQHLRRGVMGRAEYRFAHLDSGTDRPGQAEVADFRPGLLIEQNVTRLNIAMEDAVFMGMG